MNRRRSVLPKGMKNTRLPSGPMLGRSGSPRALFGTVGLALLVAASGLFHVWTRAEHLHLGYSIVAAETRVRSAEADRARLVVEEASLRNPTRIARLAGDRLGLKAPEPGQVVDVHTRDTAVTSIAQR